jgi:hypothetical protein
MASIAAVSRRRAAENRVPELAQVAMPSNGQESLSTDAQANIIWRRLLWRSGIAVLVITGVILVAALLPFPAEQSHAIQRHGCGDHRHLRHVIVLHRHGMREFGYLGVLALSVRGPCS